MRTQIIFKYVKFSLHWISLQIWYDTLRNCTPILFQYYHNINAHSIIFGRYFWYLIFEIWSREISDYTYFHCWHPYPGPKHNFTKISITTLMKKISMKTRLSQHESEKESELSSLRLQNLRGNIRLADLEQNQVLPRDKFLKRLVRAGT